MFHLVRKVIFIKKIAFIGQRGLTPWVLTTYTLEEERSGALFFEMLGAYWF